MPHQACKLPRRVNEAAAILLTTIFVNNFVTIQFLGIRPLLGASQKIDSATGMMFATTFILTLASAVSFTVERYILRPLDLQYLRIIFLIIIIASLVQFFELIIRAIHPRVHAMLGTFVPLITTNCAVLGVALINIRETNSFINSVVFGFGAAVGYSLVLIIFTAIQEQQRNSAIPKVFRGAAISMITAGLLSLAFMGFTGMS